MFTDPKLSNILKRDPSTKLKFGSDLIIAAMAIVHQATIVSFDGDYLDCIHASFPLPGLFHPGRGEWLIRHPELGSTGNDI
jgi:hypothetical protein